MRWFCGGHFVATWLVCTSLLVRFHTAQASSIAFVLFSIILWPVVLWALPLKGYFYLKSVTLDRLKARVRRGELKKAVVFGFGFCTSLLAALSIGFATWAVGALDYWFSQQSGALSLLHTIIWFPIAFLLWIVIPTLGVAVLARRTKGAIAPAGEPITA